MPREHNQKLKLLKILEMLRQETEEQHPLATSEICDRLMQMDISCDRRTLSKDITLLNKQGYEVMSLMRGHEKVYYISDRSFSVPELKIMIDAVQAASFITEDKTAALIDKIAELGGSHRAEILKDNVVHFNTRKHHNESIYYNVGFLEDALQNKRRASFRYFDLDENGEKVYRKGKDRYVVEPVALVFNEDNYYLMCYSSKYHNIVNYRVDRMDQVVIEDANISEAAIAKHDNIAEYTEQVFKMYGGPQEDISIEFDSSLIGVVYDKFGEDTKMVRTSDTTCAASVKVQISPTFWGWLFQFAGRMKILSPSLLIEKYREQAALINEDIGGQPNDDE